MDPLKEAAKSFQPLLTPAQVATRLQLKSRRQVLRLPIPRVVIGPKTIRYTKEAVDAYVIRISQSA